jgi:hypothetical protein
MPFRFQLMASAMAMVMLAMVVAPAPAPPVTMSVCCLAAVVVAKVVVVMLVAVATAATWMRTIRSLQNPLPLHQRIASAMLISVAMMIYTWDFQPMTTLARMVSTLRMLL